MWQITNSQEFFSGAKDADFKASAYFYHTLTSGDLEYCTITFMLHSSCSQYHKLDFES